MQHTLSVLVLLLLVKDSTISSSVVALEAESDRCSHCRCYCFAGASSDVPSFHVSCACVGMLN
jgi:hypothetical protein